MLSEYSDILTVDDLRKVLRIGKNVAYGLISNGAIKSLRIGHTIRIPKKFVIEYIETAAMQDSA